GGEAFSGGAQLRLGCAVALQGGSFVVQQWEEDRLVVRYGTRPGQADVQRVARRSSLPSQKKDGANIAESDLGTGCVKRRIIVHREGESPLPPGCAPFAERLARYG